jgi:hypothetical protein
MNARPPVIRVLVAIIVAGCAAGAPSRPGDPVLRPAAPGRDEVSAAPAIAGAAGDAPKAFATADGWAARTPGGRGGMILRVTTLAADGPGSLAEAMQVDAPRIVVFEVGGVIDLGREALEVEAPFLTVAGQTAPAPGITLIRGGIRIRTHDVVIQHLRVRPGEAGAGKRSGWEVDGISTSTGAYDVIIDHCSTTWATDENLSASGDRFAGSTPDEWRASTSHRITISDCLIAEGLSHATHRKGEHSKGTLIHDNVTEVAVIRNLYASNVERSPMFKGGARGIVVNNYIYNPGHTAIRYVLVDHEWGTLKYETGQMAVVGNVLRYGADTRADLPLLSVDGVGPCEVFLEDNLLEDNLAHTAARGVAIKLIGGTPANVIAVAARPLWPAGFVPLRAADVAAHIRREVGARPWDRDAIDTRIIAQALDGTGVGPGAGRVIDSESQAGGYPRRPEIHQPFDPARWDLTTMAPLTPL